MQVQEKTKVEPHGSDRAVRDLGRHCSQVIPQGRSGEKDDIPHGSGSEICALMTTEVSMITFVKGVMAQLQAGLKIIRRSHGQEVQREDGRPAVVQRVMGTPVAVEVAIVH